MWLRAKILFLAVLCFSNPDLFLPKNGHHISKRLKIVLFGTWKQKILRYVLYGCWNKLLGYAIKKIDNQVIKSIRNSNMSTFNSNMNYLAEKLIEIHDWADMARFARTGGEANSIAIRLAELSQKKII